MPPETEQIEPGQEPGEDSGRTAEKTSNRRIWLRVLVYFLAWLAMAVPAAVGIFLASERTVNVFSHDATVSPSLSGYVTVRTGPLLPDVRRETGFPLGIDIVLGKTEAASIEEAVERYAFIASQPDSQVTIITDALTRLAIDAALRGGLIALIPILVWFLIGRERRIELFGRSRLRRAATAGLVIVVGTASVVVLVNKSWLGSQPIVVDETEWLTLEDYLPEVMMPSEVRDIEIQGTLSASETRRLVLSAIETYETSSTFYDAATERASRLELREPEEGETVALFVSDRHDNIGMDPVARAIGDRAGATVVLNAGDDTSSGQSWEAFSLDSLAAAFEEGYERYAVQGNHDHGGFVEGYLAERDWITATNGPIDAGPLGVFASWNDPRSSGLGTWRDQIGMSIGELSVHIADEICEGERVNTLMVHDVNTGREALARGCVDLVIAGHLHVATGPDAVLGGNGEVGYKITNGTTGGAAFAVAVGTKLRRAADVTLITYRDQRPVGIQVVSLQTHGGFTVHDYVPLTYAAEDADEGVDLTTPEDAETPADETPADEEPAGEEPEPPTESPETPAAEATPPEEE